MNPIFAADASPLADWLSPNGIGVILAQLVILIGLLATGIKRAGKLDATIAAQAKEIAALDVLLRGDGKSIPGLIAQMTIQAQIIADQKVRLENANSIDIVQKQAIDALTQAGAERTARIDQLERNQHNPVQCRRDIDERAQKLHDDLAQRPSKESVNAAHEKIRSVENRLAEQDKMVAVQFARIETLLTSLVSDVKDVKRALKSAGSAEASD